jgi:ribonuclease HI
MCAERNPNGVGTFACIIRDGKKEIYRSAGVIGEGRGMSSNTSEYVGLIAALTALKDKNLTDRDIVVYTDSEVLARQMGGEWRAVSGFYMSYYLRAKRLRYQFTNLKFQWIPREENEEADAETKRVYSQWCKANNRKPIYKARKG